MPRKKNKKKKIGLCHNAHIPSIRNPRYGIKSIVYFYHIPLVKWIDKEPLSNQNEVRLEGPDLETKENNIITGYVTKRPGVTSTRASAPTSTCQPRHRYIDVYILPLAHLSSNAHNFGGGILFWPNNLLPTLAILRPKHCSKLDNWTQLSKFYVISSSFRMEKEAHKELIF